jgi:hypothetical protein
MDFFQSHQTVPKPLLSYLLPYSRTFNCTSKTTGWFTKGADPNLPHANKVLLQGSTRILIYIDGLLSVAPNCAQAVAIFHIPERSIALVKRLAGSPKELKLIPTCPTLTKCYSKVAHAFLYTWNFFQSHQTVPKPLLSYLLPYSRTFNCTSKTTGWFTKGLKLIPYLLTVLLQGSTRILIYIDGLLSVAPNCAQALLSYLLPYSRTFNCTSKTTGWFTKGLK